MRVDVKVNRTSRLVARHRPMTGHATAGTQSKMHQNLPNALERSTYVVHGERHRDEGYRYRETDPENISGHKIKGHRGRPVRVLREIGDLNREKGGDEGHREEDDGDNGEDHDRLALSCGRNGPVGGEACLEGIRLFLFEVEKVGERRVDAFGLLVHPLEIFDMHVDCLQLVLGLLSTFECLEGLPPSQLVEQEISQFRKHGRLVLENHLDDVDLIADVLDFSQQLCLRTNIQQGVLEEVLSTSRIVRIRIQGSRPGTRPLRSSEIPQPLRGTSRGPVEPRKQLAFPVRLHSVSTNFRLWAIRVTYDMADRCLKHV